jgi:transcriptional regulator with XRE-family HTH domain
MPNDEPSTANPARAAVAAEVRAEVARQNKTQRELGDILGLPQSAISKRLDGTRAFRAEELVKLADALGVPIARFRPTTDTESAGVDAA